MGASRKEKAPQGVVPEGAWERQRCGMAVWAAATRSGGRLTGRRAGVGSRKMSSKAGGAKLRHSDFIPGRQ